MKAPAPITLNNIGALGASQDAIARNQAAMDAFATTPEIQSFANPNMGGNVGLMATGLTTMANAFLAPEQRAVAEQNMQAQQAKQVEQLAYDRNQDALMNSMRETEQQLAKAGLDEKAKQHKAEMDLNWFKARQEKDLRTAQTGAASASAAIDLNKEKQRNIFNEQYDAMRGQLANFNTLEELNKHIDTMKVEGMDKQTREALKADLAGDYSTDFATSDAEKVAMQRVEEDMNTQYQSQINEFSDAEDLYLRDNQINPQVKNLGQDADPAQMKNVLSTWQNLLGTDVQDADELFHKQFGRPASPEELDYLMRQAYGENPARLAVGTDFGINDRKFRNAMDKYVKDVDFLKTDKEYRKMTEARAKADTNFARAKEDFFSAAQNRMHQDKLAAAKGQTFQPFQLQAQSYSDPTLMKNTQNLLRLAEEARTKRNPAPRTTPTGTFKTIGGFNDQ